MLGPRHSGSRPPGPRRGPETRAGARQRSVRLAAVLAGVAFLCWLQGLRLLVLKWQGVDVAVFEADTASQGVQHALAIGDLSPWGITGRFWPFLLMAPGIYLHVPVLVALPSGLSVLAMQALAVGATAVLLAALVRSHDGDPVLAAGLALCFMLHPITGVAMAWGWSAYVTAAPLLVGGMLARRRGRPGLAVLLLAVAALMKVNVVLMVAGIGAWLWAGLSPDGDGSRRWGRGLALGAACGVVLSGTAFVASTWCVGTFREDVNLGGTAPPTASGLFTLLLVVVPLLPLWSRRGRLLAAAAVGIELAYTLLVNPANSGLVPATAVLFVAAAVDLAGQSRPRQRLAVAGVLALAGQLVYQPPRISPLPLTPQALTYRADPRGAVLRDWVDALPDDATLVTAEPVSGAIGPHPGVVMAPWAWSGDGRVAVMLSAEGARVAGLSSCTSTLTEGGRGRPEIVAGWCGEGEAPPLPPTGPQLQCLQPERPSSP